MTLTPLQLMVAKHYEGGEYGSVAQTSELEGCGDGLFTFCVIEAGDAKTIPEYCAMLDVAIDQLIALKGELT